jgi:hypothetical protein
LRADAPTDKAENAAIHFEASEYYRRRIDRQSLKSFSRLDFLIALESAAKWVKYAARASLAP